MYELLYNSFATRPMKASDLNEILEVARRFNAENDITGMLVYFQETREFYQLLEGERETVHRLLDKISLDSRHTSLDILHAEPVKQRSFLNWTMAFKEFKEGEYLNKNGRSCFLEKGFTNELVAFGDVESKSRRLMRMLRKEMLIEN